MKYNDLLKMFLTLMSMKCYCAAQEVANKIYDLDECMKQSKRTVGNYR